jgi:hypothetical protein
VSKIYLIFEDSYAGMMFVSAFATEDPANNQAKWLNEHERVGSYRPIFVVKEVELHD